VKAFLLAAGNGTRLRPLTDSTSKCLLPIRGIPLLQIWLQQCKRLGVGEVLINVHSHAASVREFLACHANGTRMRVEEEPQLLGSAGTLRQHRDWVASDDCFWVFYADVLNCARLEDMLRLHRERRPAATLGVCEVSDPSRCGIVSVDEHAVIHEFVEKPERPATNLAFSGLMIATSELLDAIPDQMPADIGFHVLPRLAGRMLSYPITDYLLDVGTKENYQAAQTSWPGLSD
jgi:mannose-1-phosphate guanylyltransferase